MFFGGGRKRGEETGADGVQALNYATGRIQHWIFEKKDSRKEKGRGKEKAVVGSPQERRTE